MVQLTHTPIIAKSHWRDRHPAFCRGSGAALLSCSLLLGHLPRTGSVLVLTSVLSLLLQCLAAALLTRHTKAIAVLAVLLLPMAAYWPQEAGVVDACSLYAASMGVMLFVFARSLLPSQQPLVAAIASRVHGPLRSDIARYTHALTFFWSLFFALALIMPAILFWLGPAGAWRWPLTGGTFAAALVIMVAEAGVRRMVIRNFKHVSLRTTITAFRNSSATTTQPTTSDAYK
ncbi:MAG: hypothetical protein ABF636_01705 [Acetobacter sp.]